MAGKDLADIDYQEGSPGHVAVKEVVPPFENLPGVDPLLGPEMQSTGEVMGISGSFDRAYYKAQLAAGNELPKSGNVMLSVRDADKDAIVPIAKELVDSGLELLCTEGTANYLEDRGVELERVNKISQGSPDVT